MRDEMGNLASRLNGRSPHGFRARSRDIQNQGTASESRPQVISSINRGISRSTVDLMPRKILLVDDDADTLSSLGEALRVIGHSDVVTAASGEEALAKIKETNPDTMITDFRMPGMDGVELTKRARRLRPHLSVVMITAFSKEEGLEHEAQDAGVCEVVPKPIDLTPLLDAVADCARATR